MANANHPFVFIGNWDRHKSPPQNGFGIFSFDSETGRLTPAGAAAPEITVGAACLNPQRTILYCVDEYTTLPGYFLGGGGQVYAFKIDAETGALSEINHRPSFGSLPSSLTIDASGAYLIATHHTDRVPITKIARDDAGAFRIALDYDDATTVLFPLLKDGAIGEPCDVFKHAGDGGPLPRQTHPQLHSVTAAPSGNLFLVCDKGNDELVFFRIDRETKTLRRCGDAFKTLPGSSPRYAAFHPTRPFVFVNHETKAIVSALRYDEAGSMELIATVSALPSGQEDSMEMKQSDILIDRTGRRLYSMIRGISAIPVFDVDQTSGSIERIDTVQLDVLGPRGGAISPDGRFMVIAAWESKEVTVWNIGGDGALSPTGHKLKQSNPGTVTFL